MAGFNINQEKLSEEFVSAMNRFTTSLEKPSILLAGATGCGKSTLCNLVFKKEICKVGQGSPVTKGINQVSDDKNGVIIYDSEGYELGASFNNTDKAEGTQDYHRTIFDFINSKDLEGTPVDVVWYCISAPAARVTDVDISVVEDFNRRNKPCAVILTQVDVSTEEDCKALKDVIREKMGDDIEIFESSTDETIELEKGLDDLHEWTASMIVDSRRDSFIFASNRDLNAKRDLCRTYVMYSAMAAGAAALSPIPMSDAMIITPIQITMVGKIVATWDLMSVRDAVKGIILEVIVQNIGKTLAGNIIKMIPGLGSWVGGAINATVAASITYGVGFAFNEVCYKTKNSAMEGNATDISSYFNSDFVASIEKYIQEFRKNKDLIEAIKNFKNKG